MRYWVVGGEYASTDFKEIAAGRAEELVGPFATYEAAYEEWQRRAWQYVDNCHVRYRIIGDKTDWHPTGLGPEEWK